MVCSGKHWKRAKNMLSGKIRWKKSEEKENDKEMRREREKHRHGELGKVENRFGIMEWGVIKGVERRQKKKRVGIVERVSAGKLKKIFWIKVAIVDRVGEQKTKNFQ